MPRVYKPKTVSSYPVEFFDIWKLATEGTLSLEFLGRNTATNFRHRLYAFRKRLMEENPIEGGKLYQVDLEIKEEITMGVENTCKYLLVPFTPEWKRQLREALAGQGPTPAAGTGQVFDSVLEKHFKS